MDLAGECTLSRDVKARYGARIKFLSAQKRAKAAMGNGV
jgi:hypothetical protein